MINLSKDLYCSLVKRADKLQERLNFQIAALEALRADLQVSRADLQRLSPDTGTDALGVGTDKLLVGTPRGACISDASGTDLVPELENTAGVAGAVSNAVGLLAGVANGKTWPTVGELGMCGLLRLDKFGRVRGLTEAELLAWLVATGTQLIGIGEGMVALPRHANLVATVAHLGRYGHKSTDLQSSGNSGDSTSPTVR